MADMEMRGSTDMVEKVAEALWNDASVRAAARARYRANRPAAIGKV